MFDGELDMLEMRLNHLAGKVHRTVITEASVTHRGVPKPLRYTENRERFAAFADWITFVEVSELPEGSDHWQREHAQRDAAWHHLAGVRPDDILLVADCDEIPSDAALGGCPEQGAAALRQRVFHSACDWEYPVPQLTSVVVRAGCVSGPRRPSLSQVRDQRHALPVIEDGGWHFSWLGTEADRERKLAATCHTEMPRAEWEAIRTGATWNRGEHHAPDSGVVPVTVDETWPAWIRDGRCPPYWLRPRMTEGAA